MSIEVIQGALDATTPGLNAGIPWNDIQQALVISFTNTNTGDLHIEVREKNGFNPTSHKTHIDVTSGGDIPAGLSPVSDFCAPNGVSGAFKTDMHRANLASLDAAAAAGDGVWVEAKVNVTALEPRNEVQNPSAQLLEKDDLYPLRTALSVDDSLVLLKKANQTLLAFGVHTTPELTAAMGGKTKRMFLHNPPENLDEIDTADLEAKLEDAFSAKSSGGKKTKGGQGWLLDPEKQKAVEDHAMQVVAVAFEAQGFEVKDVHTAELAMSAELEPHPGFDLLAGDIGIEVKGTTMSGTAVLITANELLSALDNDKNVVALVADIELSGPSPYTASGGSLRIYQWTDKAALKEIIEGVEATLEHASNNGLKLDLASLKWRLDLASGLVGEVELASFVPK